MKQVSIPRTDKSFMHRDVKSLILPPVSSRNPFPPSTVILISLTERQPGRSRATTRISTRHAFLIFLLFNPIAPGFPKLESVRGFFDVSSQDSTAGGDGDTGGCVLGGRGDVGEFTSGRGAHHRRTVHRDRFLSTAGWCGKERVVVNTTMRELVGTKGGGGAGSDCEISKRPTETGIRGPSVIGFLIVVFDRGSIIDDVRVVFVRVFILAFFDAGDCVDGFLESRGPREWSSINRAREEGSVLSERWGSQGRTIEDGAGDGFVGITGEIGLLILEFIVGSLRIRKVHEILHGFAEFFEVALRRVDSQGVSQDFEGIIGHGREDITKRHRITNVIGEDGVRGRGGLEGVTREDEIEEATSDCPDISLLRGVSVVDVFVLFRSHVPVAPGSDVDGPFVAGGESKVTEFEKRTTRAIIHDTHEDVFGFDVTMVDTRGMAVLDGVDELQHHILDGLGVTRDATLHDVLIQVSEIAVFEDKERVLRSLKGVEAVNDVIGAGESGVVIGQEGVIV